MMRSFEELDTLDHDVIVQKSHIVHSTLDDVVKKRFNKFNPVKAKGIASTLEKDFNIDMSGWLREFEEFRDSKVEKVSTVDKMALEAIQEKKAPKRKFLSVAFSVLGGIGLLYLIITKVPFSGLINEGNLTTEQYKSELNKTEEANATNNILNQTTDANGTVLPALGIPTTNEANKTAVAAPSVIPAAVTATATTKITLESPKKLWYKIIYLDNNKTDESTIEPGKLEIDGTRSKILIFGHQQMKLSFGQTVIEPKAGAKIRYLLKDKKLTPISEEEVFKLQGKPMPTSKTVLDSN